MTNLATAVVAEMHRRNNALLDEAEQVVLEAEQLIREIKMLANTRFIPVTYMTKQHRIAVRTN